MGNTTKKVTNTSFQPIDVRTYYTKLEISPRGTNIRKFIPVGEIFIVNFKESKNITIPEYRCGYDRIIVGTNEDPNILDERLGERLDKLTNSIFIALFGQLVPKHHNITTTSFEKA